jgi:hypothetical protein
MCCVVPMKRTGEAPKPTEGIGAWFPLPSGRPHRSCESSCAGLPEELVAALVGHVGEEVEVGHDFS